MDGVEVAGDEEVGENGCELVSGWGCDEGPLMVILRFLGELPYSGPVREFVTGCCENGESNVLCGEDAAPDDAPPPVDCDGGTQWWKNIDGDCETGADSGAGGAPCGGGPIGICTGTFGWIC